MVFTKFSRVLNKPRKLSSEAYQNITEMANISVLVILICMPLMLSPFRIHFLPYLANFKLSRQNEKELSFQLYNRKSPFINGKINPYSHIFSTVMKPETKSPCLLQLQFVHISCLPQPVNGELRITLWHVNEGPLESQDRQGEMSLMIFRYYPPDSDSPYWKLMATAGENSLCFCWNQYTTNATSIGLPLFYLFFSEICLFTFSCRVS